MRDLASDAGMTILLRCSAAKAVDSHYTPVAEQNCTFMACPATGKLRPMAKGENALVAWLTERFAADARRVPIGIGDDMALVRLDGSLVAITADMLLDGVHFDTERHGYELIGRKAIACSLSDCAGMACAPRAATVSIALNRDMSLVEVQRMYEGMAGVADRYGCAIVGGDTTSWDGRLAIDVAMVAEPMAARGPMCRSGARAGDTLFVSGPLGGSLLGRHLTFEPRLELARRLAGEAGLHAMMDISDGLAMDLHRLCTSSGCDAELRPELIERVLGDAAREIAKQDGRPVLEHALSDGEDFELLVVGDVRLEGAAGTGGGSGLWPVGRVVARSSPERSSLWMVLAGGKRAVIEPRGFEHWT